MQNLLATWDPARYHGWGKRPPFFEGWYFKLVDATETRRYAVIPGVFLTADPAERHCFVQTLDGVTGRTHHHRYPYEAFRAARDSFDIWVGPNHFTAEGVILDIAMPDQRMTGSLRFTGRVPWPVTLLSPGIMGPFAFVPFMECYHGVVSFDHAITGSLAVDDQRIDFAGGRGYTEKDWGQSFPRAWIWTQSNHFEQRETSLTASIATIPWLRRAFDGFIVGLWHSGKLYRFATYTGATVERLQVTDHEVLLHVADRKRRGAEGCRLELTMTRAQGGLLRSPERTAMQPRVLETLTARVHARLVGQDSGKVLFEGTGKHAGLEVVGTLPTAEKVGR
jgi:tocopherol cyclase